MIKKVWDKRAFHTFAPIGFLFGFFQVTGMDLAQSGNILWTGAYIARLLFLCVLLAVLFGGTASVVAGWTKLRGDRGGAKVKAVKLSVTDRLMKAGTIWLWLISFVLLVLSYLPFYLAYYPGICAYDTTIQMGQVVGGSYNDHHPIAHTLLLKWSTDLGQGVFGDVNTGLALLVLVQMLALAAVFAGGITVLAKRGVKGPVLIGLQLFGMLYPFGGYMSISVCKDVFFTVFLLLQMLALYEMIKCKAKFGCCDVLFVISSVGMQLFRNNGRYAMLVLMAVLMLAVIVGRVNRRFWCKTALTCAVALVLGSFCISGLFKVTGAEQGDRREMLSMPIQQLARCMVYHGGVGVSAQDDGTMKPEETALINDFLLNESYKEYRPDIADPVKRHTNTYVVRYRTGDFVRTYVGLLSRYPGDFVNAALSVNAGYLYMGDESHAYINVNGRDTGLGYVQTRFLTDELNSYGIYQDSKWESAFDKFEKWADTNAYLKLPVFKFLLVPGSCLWLYVLLAGWLFYRRQYDKCVPLFLVAGYYLTLFLGPTVQLRYIYPLVMALPLIAAWTLGGRCIRDAAESKECKNDDAE